MAVSTHRSQRYNITLSHLIRRVISMTEQEQSRLLDYIARQFAPENDTDARRTDERKTCLMTVDCLLEGRLLRNYVHDISTGGMFIETAESLAVGQVMTLSFSFREDRAPFKLQGRVAWSSPRGVGVQFVDLTPFQLSVLKNTVARMDEL